MTNEERLKFDTANVERFKTIYRVKIKRPGAEEPQHEEKVQNAGCGMHPGGAAGD